MEAVNLKQDLIHAINNLPSDMLEEMYKFLSFLEYRNSSFPNDSKEEILRNLKISAKEMQMIKDGNLEARSAKEFLNEL